MQGGVPARVVIGEHFVRRGAETKAIVKLATAAQPGVRGYPAPTDLMLHPPIEFEPKNTIA